MSSWAIGAVVYVVGSVSINIGTNFMKYGHAKKEYIRKRQAERRDNQPVSVIQDTQWYGKLRVWWLGTLMFIVGNVLNFVALGLGPQSLLASLGSVQFVSNVAFIYFFLKQKVTRRVLFATTAIVAGNVLLVIFSSHDSSSHDIEELKNLYTGIGYRAYICTVVAVALLLHVVYKLMKRDMSRRQQTDRDISTRRSRFLGFCYAMTSAIIGTQSVILAKSTSGLLLTSISGDSQFGAWFTYVILFAWLATIIFWIVRLNSALKRFDAIFIIPTLQVIWTIFSILGGGVYFNEFASYDALSIAMFVLGVVIILGGVVLLSSVEASDGLQNRLEKMSNSSTATTAPSGGQPGSVELVERSLKNSNRQSSTRDRLTQDVEEYLRDTQRDGNSSAISTYSLKVVVDSQVTQDERSDSDVSLPRVDSLSSMPSDRSNGTLSDTPPTPPETVCYLPVWTPFELHHLESASTSGDNNGASNTHHDAGVKQQQVDTDSISRASGDSSRGSPTRPPLSLLPRNTNSNAADSHQVLVESPLPSPSPSASPSVTEDTTRPARILHLTPLQAVPYVVHKDVNHTS
eukprot:GILJ01007217.1.p1 GENE.GILJ01007217.1~~GILJ01007217.1.p1  ORF type:complete len:573 (-),score=53.10 GILJ01007217.1:273-1991(-)